MAATDLLVPGSYLQSAGNDPDFSVYTAGMEPDPEGTTDRPIVRMVGSSTEKDLQGDTMLVTALADMAMAEPGLLIWMNHDYTVPHSLFGSLAKSPDLIHSNGIADLHLSVEVERDSPDAEKTYQLISKGRKFGCSVGCMVEDYEFDESEDYEGWFPPILIIHVRTIEWSVVGVPANQRSWVENAVRGIFNRTLAQGQEPDDRLARAAKSLWPRDYQKAINSLADNALRKHLFELPPRPLGPGNLMWDTATKHFLIQDPRGRRKQLERERVPAMLVAGVAETRTAVKEALAKNGAPEEIKTASGKLDWPLADRSRSWDGDAAHKRLVDWASDDDGELQPSKFKQVHFWFDPDKTDSASAGYKLPFCDIVAGAVKAIPAGVFAVANVLQGGRGGTDISEADIAKIKTKVARYYKRMADEFDDETIIAPWDKEDAATPDTAKDAIPVPPPVTKDYPAASEVEVSDNGTHPACKGMHGHPHPAYGAQGDDQTHKHSHSHDGDAIHNHTHDEEKAATPPEQTGDMMPPNITTAPQAAAPAAEVTPPLHEPAHEVVEGSTVTLTLGADKDQLLATMNGLGRILGLPAVTPDQVIARQSAADPEALRAIDLLFDGLSHLQTQSAGLMALMRHQAPTVTEAEGEQHDDDEAPIAALLLRALRITREGRELSMTNLNLIQQAHDALKDVTHGECCKAVMDSEQTAEQSQQQDGDRSNTDSITRGIDPEVVKHLEGVITAVKGLNVKTLTDQVAAAAADLDHVKAVMAKAKDDMTTLTQGVERLTNMPLPRPTTLQRTVQTDTSAATYDEMLAVSLPTPPVAPDILETSGSTPRMSLNEALTQTTLKQMQNVGLVRQWPAGIGVGVRPKLTEEQMGLMTVQDIFAYDEGGQATVPEFSASIDLFTS